MDETITPIVTAALGVIGGSVTTWLARKTSKDQTQLSREQIEAQREEHKEDYTLAGLKLLIDANHAEIVELRERYAVSQANEDRALEGEREARKLVIEWQEKYAALMDRERQERHDIRDKWDRDNARNQLEIMQRMEQVAALEKQIAIDRAEQAIKDAKCEREIEDLRAQVCEGLERIRVLESTIPRPTESVPGESDPAPSIPAPGIPLDGC